MTKQEVLDAANVMIAYANGKKVGTRPRRSMEPLLKILYVPTWNWEQKDYCIIPDHAAKESLEQSQGGQAVSDTPISDSTPHNVGDLAMVCRRLERKLAATRHYLSVVSERVKRLEEAGDELFENSNPSRWDSLEAAAQKLVDQSNWIKAKESK